MLLKRDVIFVTPLHKYFCVCWQFNGKLPCSRSDTYWLHRIFKISVWKPVHMHFQRRMSRLVHWYICSLVWYYILDVSYNKSKCLFLIFFQNVLVVNKSLSGFELDLYSTAILFYVLPCCEVRWCCYFIKHMRLQKNYTCSDYSRKRVQPIET